MDDNKFYNLYGKGLFLDKSLHTNHKTVINREVINFFVIYDLNLKYPYVINILSNIQSLDFEKLLDIIFYFRNPKLSFGYRKLSRWIYQWYLIKYPDILYNNIDKIVNNGRWDDLFYLFPNMVRLYNISYVNKNFLTDITQDKLDHSKEIQEKIVDYVCNNLLKEFQNFSKGLDISTLAKWMPSENSSFNRKYSIVNTICEKLNISLQDYRVIYITPMRKYLNICENYMCNNDWKYINYSKLSKNTMKKYSNAFKRHDFTRYNKYKKENKKMLNIKKPYIIINNYFDKILKNYTKIQKDPLLEIEWHENKEIILNHMLTDYIVITDTSGNMYKTTDNDIRYISYAIVLSILSANNLKGELTNKIYTFTDNGVNTINIQENILSNIVNIRMSFTQIPNLNSIIQNINNIKHLPKNIIYISSTDIEINDKLDKLEHNLLVWNICDKHKQYRQINDNITYLNGFRNDFFYSILSRGSYNPKDIIQHIIN